MAEHDDLSGALRKARLAEAAHFEAVLGIKDSKSLRLQVLKDELVPLILPSFAWAPPSPRWGEGKQMFVWHSFCNSS